MKSDGNPLHPRPAPCLGPAMQRKGKAVGLALPIPCGRRLDGLPYARGARGRTIWPRQRHVAAWGKVAGVRSRQARGGGTDPADPTHD